MGWEWYILLWCVTSAVDYSHQRAVHDGWYTEQPGNVTPGHKSLCTSKMKREANEILVHEEIHKGSKVSCIGESLIYMNVKHKRPLDKHYVRKGVEADFPWCLCFRAPPLQGFLPILHSRSISGEVTVQEKLKCPEIFLRKYERNLIQVFSNLIKNSHDIIQNNLWRQKKLF